MFTKVNIIECGILYKGTTIMKIWHLEHTQEYINKVSYISAITSEKFVTNMMIKMCKVLPCSLNCESCACSNLAVTHGCDLIWYWCCVCLGIKEKILWFDLFESFVHYLLHIGFWIYSDRMSHLMRGGIILLISLISLKDY